MLRSGALLALTPANLTAVPPGCRAVLAYESVTQFSFRTAAYPGDRSPETQLLRSSIAFVLDLEPEWVHVCGLSPGEAPPTYDPGLACAGSPNVASAASAPQAGVAPEAPPPPDPGPDSPAKAHPRSPAGRAVMVYLARCCLAALRGVEVLLREALLPVPGAPLTQWLVVTPPLRLPLVASACAAAVSHLLFLTQGDVGVALQDHLLRRTLPRIASTRLCVRAAAPLGSALQLVQNVVTAVHDTTRAAADDAALTREAARFGQALREIDALAAAQHTPDPEHVGGPEGAREGPASFAWSADSGDPDLSVNITAVPAEALSACYTALVPFCLAQGVEDVALASGYAEVIVVAVEVSPVLVAPEEGPALAHPHGRLRQSGGRTLAAVSDVLSVTLLGRSARGAPWEPLTVEGVPGAVVMDFTVDAAVPDSEGGTVPAGDESVCQFFDRANATRAAWSTAGCEVLGTFPGNVTRCACDHLTEFRAARLMPMPNTVSTRHLLDAFDMAQVAWVWAGLLAPLYALALCLGALAHRRYDARRCEFLVKYFPPSLSDKGPSAAAPDISLVFCRTDSDASDGCADPSEQHRPWGPRLDAVSGDLRRPLCHQTATPPASRCRGFVRLLAASHVYASLFLFDVTSAVTVVPRVLGLLAAVLTTILLMALWFAAVDATNVFVVMFQLLVIVVLNSVVMALVTKALRHPFLLCRCEEYGV